MEGEQHPICIPYASHMHVQRGLKGRYEALQGVHGPLETSKNAGRRTADQ